MSEDKSIDLLGLKPGAEAVKIVTEGAVSGLGAFLSRISLPAAEEYGLLLQDKVRRWRANNATNALAHAKKLMDSQVVTEPVGAHPRLVNNIINESSWTDDDELQQLWAGLLVSACCKDGKDEGNKIFVELLSRLTLSQVRIAQYSCARAEKVITPSGLIASKELKVSLTVAQDISGIHDIHQLDRELDHLRELGLLEHGGFRPDFKNLDAFLTPTALALNMYVRTQGVKVSPVEFFGISRPSS